VMDARDAIKLSLQGARPQGSAVWWGTTGLAAPRSDSDSDRDV